MQPVGCKNLMFCALRFLASRILHEFVKLVMNMTLSKFTMMFGVAGNLPVILPLLPFRVQRSIT